MIRNSVPPELLTESKPCFPYSPENQPENQNKVRHPGMSACRVPIDKGLRCLNSTKLNFTIVGQEKLVFQFEEVILMKFGSSRVPQLMLRIHQVMVAINASPIEYGNVLLIRRFLDCLPLRIIYLTTSLLLIY